MDLLPHGLVLIPAVLDGLLQQFASFVKTGTAAWLGQWHLGSGGQSFLRGHTLAFNRRQALGSLLLLLTAAGVMATLH